MKKYPVSNLLKYSKNISKNIIDSHLCSCRLTETALHFLLSCANCHNLRLRYFSNLPQPLTLSILEEDKKKLMQSVDRITKEKTALLEQLMKATGSSDTIESKIETEIQKLKDTLLAELSGLKNQVEKSMTFTRGCLS